MREVFLAFLRLGLTSFGGPIAHIGYFQREFVQRRGWLEPARFAELLAICQVLPGPASSQLGFAIGLSRAGLGGGLAAFAGFTLPSALALFALATAAPSLLRHPFGASALHGLKLLAVAVVAQGVWTMARSLTPDLRRLAIAASCAAVALGLGGAWAQPLAIAVGAMAGLAWVRAPGAAAAPASASASVPASPPASPSASASGPDRSAAGAASAPAWLNPRLAAACLLVFGLGLAAALASQPGPVPTPATLAAAFYRAGALVFGGGHVVLPLLDQGVVAPGWLGADRFLLGYGAAQAVPGPMFSLAAYLGASIPAACGPACGAALATLALFAPGLLLLLAVLPAWAAWTRHPRAARALAGINAGVVGLLAAALYDPLWRQGVGDALDAGIVLAALALAARRAGALWLLGWCVGAALLRQTLGW